MSVETDLEPLLEAGEIQGNILGGFNKDHQAMFALRFAGDAASVRGAKRWLATVIPTITWLGEVVEYKRERKEVIRTAGAEPNMPVVWKSIAFTHAALAKLTPTAEQFADPVFRDGMNRAASGRLGDPVTEGIDGHIESWLVGRPGEEPDILLIIAGDDPKAVEAEAAAQMAAATAVGIVCSPCDIGHDLSHYEAGGAPFPRGREHFGFKDGVSQPGVRGRVSPAPEDFLTPRVVASSANELDPEFGEPGQPLLCTGEFVLGYARQNENFPRQTTFAARLGPRDGDPDPDAEAPWWARNGSFLVFRRLEQNVPAFNRFLAVESTRLGLGEHALGARLVGRWRSGAPILRSPDDDNDALGRKSPANNAFGYAAETDPGDGFGVVPDDTFATACPAGAHIRKVNPRDTSTDQGAPSHTLVHRMLRRGIPYGPPLPIGSQEDPGTEKRGLLFVSYQASIRDQFEFVASSWANDTAKPFTFNPPEGTGHDLVIGQLGDERRRFCVVGAAGETATTMERFVTATGGGYFFAPSRTALESVLTAP